MPNRDDRESSFEAMCESLTAGLRRTFPPLADPAAVGARAVDLHDALTGDPDIQELVDAAGQRLRGGTTRGILSIENLNLHDDADPLLNEAFRIIAIRAALTEISGSEETGARLLIPGPLTEAEHAVLWHYPLLTRIAARADVWIIRPRYRPSAGPEDLFDADRANGTHLVACYRAAFGDPPARYWIGGEEAHRRHEILQRRLASIGIHHLPYQHQIDFTDDLGGPPPFSLARKPCPYHSV